MAVDIPSYDPADDDYIDMEVSSYTNFLCHSKSSPPRPREFEFQMSLNSRGREPTTSPADELFYNGKLLPLHHPPRLQMVEKLLQKSNSDYDCRKDNFEEFYSTPLTTAVNTPTATSTPFESCNISPSESCRISRELNPDEYLLEYSADATYLNGESSKKSWTRKLKHSSLGLKLKASRAYIKSLFTKSGCSDESCAAATKIADEGSASKAHECSKKCAKVEKRKPLGQIPSSIANFNKEKGNTENRDRNRRSFSMTIKRQPDIKPSSSASLHTSSSSYSHNSSAYFLKRCGSVNSEIENSIQGAIAHCKQSHSQQPFRSRKTVSEVGIYLLSSSSLAVSGDQEIPELCRG
ncbi:probable membrane-associated kinase regulator 4 [Momordica charantia]|uniref:Probable membrane-associated kinase regulator 4 n=1 Tax=Momordica charantia TaxID=3673 RepID=A0A6J1CCE6_MOMCH|nr:probable membrane-associated kinase regulator 4 [Momordica charantia]